MIPSDLAARLRLLVQSSVQPLPAVHEIPSDLPPFNPGQRFTARIESVLPDGSFRAVVAGKTVTLSLPQSAKAGDSLELVVLDRTPRLVIAALARPATGQPPAGQPAASLSPTAQLIGMLLTGPRGEPTRPAPLARGAPLLSSPPRSGAVLAPLLRKALVESGVFYESHQAQWVAGRLPLGALLVEPQGDQSPLLQPPSGPGNAAVPGSGAPPRSAFPELRLLGQFLGIESSNSPVDEPPQRPAGPATPMPGAAALPEELANVVQQQLEALATHHAAWQGQAWPGQPIELEIEEPTTEREGDGGDQAGAWRTTLRLTLPRMGHLAATLSLTAQGVTLDIRTGDERSDGDLRAGRDELAQALSAAGVPLLGMKVEHGGRD